MREVILGHRGMVGSALHRMIPDAKTFSRNMDLSKTLPCGLEGADVLYLCAARVGGIGRNTAEPGSMIYDNLMIQCNVIEAARLAGIKLTVFLGSSCIYPAVCNYAIPEDALMGGYLEPSNEAYAVAKIAGIKMLEAYHRQYGIEYLAVMPCNLYGPGDNFEPETSHFLPAMIRKFHEAKVSGAEAVILWGTGTPRREVMHVDDCARIITELVHKGARGLINIGPGVDYSIKEFSQVIARLIVDYKGAINWDASKPDGVGRKLLNVQRMRDFGISPLIGDGSGMKSTYEWFLENKTK